MFCFQCEQTASGAGCAGARGVCGKTAEISDLQDELTGELIALARAAARTPLSAQANAVVLDALFATLTNVNFSEASLRAKIEATKREAAALGAGPAYDLKKLWGADEDVRTLKTLILLGVRGVAAYAGHAAALGRESDGLYKFISRALAAIAEDGTELLPLVLETGRVNLEVMELLDRAHVETYGEPKPATVRLGVGPGPFIVISGHDLRDLSLLLEQTAGRGVNVYTHGEMLPAHGYPELKKHSHLKGHFGTAWQNQRQEFNGLPGAILFTTNCLMPPEAGYADRAFTTAAVAYPGLPHIGVDKNFGPVIEKALSLGGYKEEMVMTGQNGGSSVTTGFGRGAVLSKAGPIIEAVKAGAIKHFFLVGGCDGAKPGRNYYTEFVKATPKDTVVLTLACGKFRFNDLDLGEIGGLPRLMDIGQCNDAYSAIRIAVALSEAFGCGVNDLPLTLSISWFEQKAVSILLTLLHLGIKNIILGPSLPAFVSPNILKFLVENFGLAAIETPEKDLAKILKR